MRTTLVVALWVVLFGLLGVFGYDAAEWMLTEQPADPPLVPEDEADSVRFRCTIRASDRRITCEERD